MVAVISSDDDVGILMALPDSEVFGKSQKELQ
jgi:hypothetical protein